MPKISVLIQSHNRLHGLQRALLSLAMQSFRDCEIIISDDSEIPLEVIDAMLNNMMPLLAPMEIKFRRTPPCGAAESMREAYSRSTGEYIKILHDDDYLTAHSLDVMVQALNTNNDVNAVYGQALISYGTKDQLFYCFSNNIIKTPSSEWVALYTQTGFGPITSPVCALYRRHDRFRILWDEFQSPQLREAARKTGAGTDVSLQVDNAGSAPFVMIVPYVVAVLNTDMQSTTQVDAGIESYYKMWREEYAANPPWKQSSRGVSIATKSRGIPPKKNAVQSGQAKFQQAFSLHQLGKIGEAKTIYHEILKVQPQHFECLHLLGVIAIQTREPELGIQLINDAIKLNPNVASAYSNLGLALQNLKRLDEALACYDKALVLEPDYADAYYNRGNTLKGLKRLDEALASYDKALALKPDSAEAYSNRGNALKDLKRLDEALASYDRGLALKPDNADTHNNRGIALQGLKRLDEALASYDKALALKPDYAEAYSNRGLALQDLKRLDEALASYDKALALKPDFAEAYKNRAFALQDLNRLDEALASYDKALALKPDCEFLFGTYLHTKMMLCSWDSLSESILFCEDVIARNTPVSMPFTALSFLDKPELHKLASKVYAESRHPKSHALGDFAKRTQGGKIRVGYYSADFHSHATAYLMAELFEAHDTDKFEIYGFSFGPNKQDDMRKRISSATYKFIDVRDKSDREVAKLSRELGIDIAVDLKGYTQDSRTGIFAEGCAPLQVNYLGYPGTMGADYIDYIIADKTVIPEHSQPDFTEKVVYLPDSYQVNDSQRKISERVFTKQELGLPETGFIFCCFNNNYKILPATFNGWVRILKAVEGSVLWLLEDNPTAANNLRKEAEARGVDSTRLIFAKRMKLDDHLARHRLADIFIDTLPCNAHTTTSDALWAGLPVLTCMGKSFAGRVAASLLNAVELPELITKTQEEYEAKAIELALNPDKLNIIKMKLKKNRLTTPLFNGKLFAKHIESAYLAMYDHYQDGLLPAGIEVQPYR